MKLGEKIFNLRQSENWSQQVLAEKLHVTRQTISRWEQGTHYPDTDSILALSKVFQVSLDELFNNEETKREVSAQSEKMRRNKKIYTSALVVLSLLVLLLAGMTFNYYGKQRQLNLAKEVKSIESQYESLLTEFTQTQVNPSISLTKANVKTNELVQINKQLTELIEATNKLNFSQSDDTTLAQAETLEKKLTGFQQQLLKTIAIHQVHSQINAFFSEDIISPNGDMNHFVYVSAYPSADELIAIEQELTLLKESSVRESLTSALAYLEDQTRLNREILMLFELAEQYGLEAKLGEEIDPAILKEAKEFNARELDLNTTNIKEELNTLIVQLDNQQMQTQYFLQLNSQNKK